MKNRITAVCIALILFSCIPAAAGCGKQENGSKQEPAAAASSVQEPSVQESAETEEELIISGLEVMENAEFGGINLKISIEDFNAYGFEFGDSVDIRYSNGYTLENIPYYNGFYTRIGDPILAGYPGYEFVYNGINCGDGLWKTSGLTEGCTAEVSLRERGAYADIQDARDIHYKDDREAYDSDVRFANFRSMEGGSLKENYLYRSASPCDNQHNRAGYVNALMEEAGVKYIIDLADTDEKIKGYMEKEDFASAYFQALYESGNVIPLALNANYGSEDFARKIASGLEEASGHEGPYLIHCTEGKDRTGFVCMLLEALAGASYEEIEADYMTTYDNYYKINPEKDKEKYDTIIREVLNPMIEIVAGSGADIKTADLVQGAEAYLKFGGMDDADIAKLKEAIME